MSNHAEGTPISQLMAGGGGGGDEDNRLVDEILADIGAAPQPIQQQPQHPQPPISNPHGPAAGGPTNIITDQNSQYAARSAERQMDAGIVHHEDAMPMRGPAPAASTRMEGFSGNYGGHSTGAGDEAPPSKTFSVWDILLEELKTPILVALLVGLFVSPFFEDLMIRVLPFVAANSIAGVVIKASLAGLIFYALKTAILY